MSQRLKQVDDISLGKNLKKLRKAAHLTQNDVITQLQLRGLSTSRSAYSQMEGGTYNVRISELIVLKEIFQVEFNDFFEGLSIPSPEDLMMD